jgi:hypothetical protein
MELVASRVTVAGGEVGRLDPAACPQRPGICAQYGAGHRGGRGVAL